MPHSGGGGSHSGGSHSSHHSSSHHGGSHSSRPANRVSSSYYPGSRRYVYYYNRSPRYYYARERVSATSTISGIMQIVWGIVWMLALSTIAIPIISTMIAIPLPLNYDHEIVIDDGLNIVENRSELISSLTDFQNKTGVTVGIVTRDPENAYMGSTRTDEAYNCYVSRWDDESHWLIYYVGTEHDRSDDWDWELMCGNDCTRILPTSTEDLFSNDLHRYLVATERYSFDEAISTALGNIQISKINKESLPMLIFILPFIIIGVSTIINGIRSVIKSKSPEEQARRTAVEIPTNTTPDEITCDYCSCIYIAGTCTECPHCGAPTRR